MSVLSCYKDQDILCLEADCEIETVKMIDVSGRVVRSVSVTGDKTEIQIGDDTRNTALQVDEEMI